MNKVLYLAIVGVICGTLNAKVSEVIFTIEDTKHTSITDREVVFTCSYKTDKASDKPTVEIKNTIYGDKPLFTQEYEQEGWARHYPGKIDEIVYDRFNKDNHLVKFAAINPKDIQNEYECVVSIDQYTSKISDLIAVYSQTEIINYDIINEHTLSHEFKKSDTLETYCKYSLPKEEKFVKLEFVKEGDTFFEYVSKTQTTAFYGKGIDKYGVSLVEDKDGYVELNIKSAVEDTQGKFLCKLTYKKGDKNEIVYSEPIQLQYVASDKSGQGIMGKLFNKTYLH